jgi:hypothetical protein
MLARGERSEALDAVPTAHQPTEWAEDSCPRPTAYALCRAHPSDFVCTQGFAFGVRTSCGASGASKSQDIFMDVVENEIE